MPVVSAMWYTDEAPRDLLAESSSAEDGLTRPGARFGDHVTAKCRGPFAWRDRQDIQSKIIA